MVTGGAEYQPPPIRYNHLPRSLKPGTICWCKFELNDVEMLPIEAGIVVIFSMDACGLDSVKGRAEELPIWLEFFLGSNSFNALPISLRTICKLVTQQDVWSKEENISQKQHKKKVVIIMGATGTGKSKLSVHLASRYKAELINSDKMQVYKGLDIVTNKVTMEEQCGVPHHLLGILDPYADFTVDHFRDMVVRAIESIVSRGHLPIIVGGSNTYIEALIDDEDNKFRSKYDCCFLWVDVPKLVLDPFLSKRVDKMIENGMVDELRKMFDPNVDYSQGIFRSIGVPEFDQYFRNESSLDKETNAMLIQKAINKMKENTYKLACRQVEKIYRLRDIKGWNIHRLDATQVIKKSGKESDEAWNELVAGPSVAIVGQFLRKTY
ncbi:adenylate isopentenyltransferase 3, chloroplastic-like [Castanea sativa]|uniref:adenylate isopentenyltransferase 3, chloroplastic-like n=1 Tax=Castanea sativa TaxID=21020 RepID=UPI003F65139B